MSRDWESIFSSWAKPPSKTEQERCDKAVQAIRNAVSANQKLQKKNIQIIVQGFYRNNTNVRQDSDIDIGVLCFDTFFYDLPEGYTAESFSITRLQGCCI
ncbi:MAG: hypothetical protein HY755_10795 [Nitrospirae bacterium]|nr:hypothetical protein [Nitrospirota bacterium]